MTHKGQAAFSTNETLDTHIGPYITHTKRMLSPAGLFSHIYDMREPRDIIRNERNVGPANVGGFPSQYVAYTIRTLYYLSITSVGPSRTLFTYLRCKGTLWTQSHIATHGT